MDSIDKFNKLSKTEFISIFGNIFEKTEWIAERCYESKPYNNLDELVSKMMKIFENIEKERHLEILNSHPDLAVKKKLTEVKKNLPEGRFLYRAFYFFRFLVQHLK